MHYSIRRLSKLVFHPLELPIVMLPHVPTQLVLSVTSWPGCTVLVTVDWPAQAMVTVLAVVPPL